MDCAVWKKGKKKKKGGGLAHIRYRSSSCFLGGPKGPFPGLPASWEAFYWIFSSCLSRSDRREVGGGGKSKGGSGNKDGARQMQNQLRIDRRYEGKRLRKWKT